MAIEVHVELRTRDTINAVKRGDVIVIIDVLRCSSTIITALANGASEIIPTPTVRKAKQMKQRNPAYILAGERKGLKPKGFDLGNSPSEFTPKKIRGRGIILTTTDGTRAFEIAKKSARPVLVGCFLNAEAVGKKLYELAYRNNCGVSLIACGRKGKLSIEDFVCTGRILEMMPVEGLTLSDSALVAIAASEGAGEKVVELVRSSEHGG
ncbi:MAG: 2-phosphosulfolactate phosphatase, partial [Candidatus Bathyarchaeia archaeon]